MNASSSPTVTNWLRDASSQLKKAGISSHQLDTLILLEFVTGSDRAHILAHPEKSLSPEQLETLKKLLSRREKRVPIPYITNEIEFYGRTFYVDGNVLIPRPESESFISLLKKHKLYGHTIVDVGCGSGVIGITAKLEFPNSPVNLIDSDKKALRVAKKNATNLKADTTFKQHDLLDGNKYSLVLANLPYVPKDLEVGPELDHEPPQALFAEREGMELYHDMWNQLAKRDARFVLTESLVFQHKQMNDFATKAGYTLGDSDNLVQLFNKV